MCTKGTGGTDLVGTGAMNNSEKKKRSGIYAGPWMIVGAVTILLIVVIVLAVSNIHRERRYMAQILSEKGASLIKAFEAGARTGMMGMNWRGNQIQNLLEELRSTAWHPLPDSN
jgi:two-component system sensor histidine kinase HydH